MQLHPLLTTLEKPLRFNNPFDYEPHPLCLQAADEVKRFIASQPELLADAERGKMFGVLVVEPSGEAETLKLSKKEGPPKPSGQAETLTPSDGGDSLRRSASLFYLAAYSGLLAGRNDWPFFVPPVFDAQQPDGHFKQTERLISSINAQLVRYTATLSQSSSQPSSPPSLQPSSPPSPLSSLKQQRRRLSEDLQLWLFRQYRMLNARGEAKDLVDIWRSYHRSPKLQQRFPLPPGGSGDCCAPKLLQYAYQHGLRPVAIAEFWYGASPKGEIRHHGQFYPACRGKCLPILTHMLQGLDVEPATTDRQNWAERIEVLFADDSLLVVSKPSGLLSVPGRTDAPSVETLLAEQYGRVFMPHRLDMDTSGLMVVARSEAAYKHLQQQFFARDIYKRYIALLSKPLSPSLPLKGTIALPLRPDPLDRPRQVVDPLHGKQAVTDYEVLVPSIVSPSHDDHATLLSLVSLIPHTGRTHQLRVHCAHPDGLNSPILGDALYGQKAQRLCLHAAELSFTHPVSGERLTFKAPAPDFCPDIIEQPQ